MLGRRHLGLADMVRRGNVLGSIGLRESSTGAQGAALAKSSAHYDLVVVGSGPAAQVR